MRVLRPSVTMLTGLLLALAAANAPAQTITSPYRWVEESQSVGLFAGHVHTDPGALDLGPRSGTAFGARYSLRLSGPFTLEGSASYLPTSRMVYDTVPAADGFTSLGETDFDLLLVDAALRFNLTGPRTFYDLMPYVAFGGGAAIELNGTNFLDAELPADVRADFGTTFAGQVGAGVEWFMTRRFTLRAGIRDVFWRIEAPAAFTERDLDVATREWVQNFYFLAGLSYRL